MRVAATTQISYIKLLIQCCIRNPHHTRIFCVITIFLFSITLKEVAYSSMKGDGHNLFQDVKPISASREWDKPQKTSEGNRK